MTEQKKPQEGQGETKPTPNTTQTFTGNEDGQIYVYDPQKGFILVGG